MCSEHRKRQVKLGVLTKPWGSSRKHELVCKHLFIADGSNDVRISIWCVEGFAYEVQKQIVPSSTCMIMINNNQNACQPGLGACAASPSSPGRLVLSDLIGARTRQMSYIDIDEALKG